MLLLTILLFTSLYADGDIPLCLQRSLSNVPIMETIPEPPEKKQTGPADVNRHPVVSLRIFFYPTRTFQVHFDKVPLRKSLPYVYTSHQPQVTKSSRPPHIAPIPQFLPPTLPFRSMTFASIY